MLAIKLSPVGKKKQISFRIVINEKRSKSNGKCVEDLGWYNPHTNKFSLKADRVQHWLSVGAQPTDTVHNILVKAKLTEGSKIPVHKKSKHELVAPEVKTEAPASAAVESTVEAPAPAVEEPVTEKVEEPVVAEVVSEEPVVAESAPEASEEVTPAASEETVTE